MRRLFSFISVILFSLAIISCQENADLDAGTDGHSYIEYYTIDGSNKLIRTITPESSQIYEYLITTDRFANKYIKDASVAVGYHQESGPQTGRYTVVNKNYLNTFIEEEICLGCDDEVIQEIQERLNEWVGTPTKPQGEVFEEPVIIYAEDAVFVENPQDESDQFTIITKAFYAKKTDVYGNGSRLIIEASDLDVYVYEDVLEGEVPPLSWINFKNTVDVKKKVPNFQ